MPCGMVRLVLGSASPQGVTGNPELAGDKLVTRSDMPELIPTQDCKSAVAKVLEWRTLKEHT
jgi:hypothetical protein